MATNVETLKQEEYLGSDTDRLGRGEADRIANMGGTPDDKMTELLELLMTFMRLHPLLGDIIPLYIVQKHQEFDMMSFHSLLALEFTLGGLVD